jgi:hypothetical protein
MDKQVEKDRAMADFRMRYQVTIDDIKYIKTRQWAVTYYLLLLYAAVIGFYKIMKPDHGIIPCWQKVVLYLTIVGIAVFGIFFLNKLEKTLARYRKRLIDDIVPNLSEDFRACEEEALRKRFGDNWRDKYTSQYRDFFQFTLYLILMLLIGACFIFYYFFLMST